MEEELEVGGDWDEDGPSWGGGGFFDESLQDIERSNVSKLQAILLDIEDLLYAPLSRPGTDEVPMEAAPTSPPASKDGEDLLGGHEYERYCSVGYGAHHDAVDEEELLSWKRRFPYLRVEPSLVLQVEDNESGERLSSCIPAASKPVESTAAMEVGGNCTADLCLIGERIVIPAIAAAHCPEEEEILAQDGLLEEFITVDVPSAKYDDIDVEEKKSGHASDEGLKVLSPNSSKRQEVIDSIFDALWPSVVEQLTPLIEKIASLPPEYFVKEHHREEPVINESNTEEGGCSEGW